MARSLAPRILCAALAVLSVLDAPASAQSDSRPNIIYVMSDDHALRTIGAYNDGFHPTPNLDRISNEGAVFENAFVGNSICGPSRAAILTGTHGHVNGITGNGEPWDSTQAVFPRLLQQAGYQTALFGKWHLNSRPADEYDEYTILTGAGKQGFYYNPEVYSPDDGHADDPGLLDGHRDGPGHRLARPPRRRGAVPALGPVQGRPRTADAAAAVARPLPRGRHPRAADALRRPGDADA